MTGIKLVWHLERCNVTIEVPNLDVKKLRADLSDALRDIDKQLGVSPAEKPKSVSCVVCGKVLPGPRSIGGHMKSHSGPTDAEMEDLKTDQQAIHVPEDPDGVVLQEGFSESD
jgi:hypothetical protein